MTMTMEDEVKDSNILSHGACADDVKLKTKEMTRLCAQTMRAQALWVSVEVVSGVRIVQCHAIMDVVIGPSCAS